MKFLSFFAITLFLLYLFRGKIRKRTRPALWIFLAWEGMAWLIVNSFKYWIDSPLKPRQIFSWALLLVFIVLAHSSIQQYKQWKAKRAILPNNSAFENRAKPTFMTSGVYTRIRHPMYCSIICLAVALFLKNIRFDTFLVSIFTSLSVYQAARLEERINTEKFGDQYVQYISRTKMFIPEIF